MTSKVVGWRVYLEDGEYLTTVYFTCDCKADYVKQSLIDHDGYDPSIIVTPEKEKPNE